MVSWQRKGYWCGSFSPSFNRSPPRRLSNRTPCLALFFSSIYTAHCIFSSCGTEPSMLKPSSVEAYSCFDSLNHHHHPAQAHLPPRPRSDRLFLHSAAGRRGKGNAQKGGNARRIGVARRRVFSRCVFFFLLSSPISNTPVPRFTLLPNTRTSQQNLTAPPRHITAKTTVRVLAARSKRRTIRASMFPQFS